MMPNQNEPADKGGFSHMLAIVTISFVAVTIGVIAVVIIWSDNTAQHVNTMTVFNVLVPVFASWVGTVLAFYFGRENFESASSQVRKTSEQVISMAQGSVEQRAAQPITEIMRSFAEMTHVVLPAGGAAAVPLADVLSKFTVDVTRMPILDEGLKPKYLIHKSSIDTFTAEGGDPASTLQQFIDTQATKNLKYDNNNGFAVVSQTSTVAAAKTVLDTLTKVKDIFVTATGKTDEAVLGLVTDARLLKHLQA